jgi:hypothetical protein
VDRTVARLNIEHYRRLLAGETDEARRQALQRLSAEEAAKLGEETPAGTRKSRPALAAVLPFAPMGRIDIEPLARFPPDPAVGNAPASKYQGVLAMLVDDGKFDLAVEGRGRGGLPHACKFAASAPGRH